MKGSSQNWQLSTQLENARQSGSCPHMLFTELAHAPPSEATDWLVHTSHGSPASELPASAAAEQSVDAHCDWQIPWVPTGGPHTQS